MTQFEFIPYSTEFAAREKSRDLHLRFRSAFFIRVHLQCKRFVSSPQAKILSSELSEFCRICLACNK